MPNPAFWQGNPKADLEEFQSLLLQVEAKSLNSWRTGGLSLLQKCCSAGLGRADAEAGPVKLYRGMCIVYDR